MGWSPDLIAGVAIAVALALIGWGGTAYCWYHKKHHVQGDVSTVDKWLSKKGTTGAGLAGAHAGYANTEGGTEMQRPRRTRRGDVEQGHGAPRVVDGVDNTGEPAPPPPVYSPAVGAGEMAPPPPPPSVGRESRHPGEAPRYSLEGRT